jgi:co-chaperonin GroES (HSP10)
VQIKPFEDRVLVELEEVEAYTCPFVPVENWLAVPIRAGEKNHPLKGG